MSVIRNKRDTSRRRIATHTAVWSTWVTLFACAGPRWLTLACEIATRSDISTVAHLYRVDRMAGLATFLAVVMVLIWLAALIIPLVWLIRRYATWRKWMAYIPPAAVLVAFLLSLWSFGFADFAAYFAAL
ncbi:MAG: hypothetical protein J6X61_01330 [Clostridia bacterium]|nr:hypothetical protein [Clostridia bacterium]